MKRAITKDTTLTVPFSVQPEVKIECLGNGGIPKWVYAPLPFSNRTQVFSVTSLFYFQARLSPLELSATLGFSVYAGTVKKILLRSVVHFTSLLRGQEQTKERTLIKTGRLQ